MLDGKTMKLVQAGRVLVGTIKRGTFSLPAGQSRSAARRALRNCPWAESAHAPGTNVPYEIVKRGSLYCVNKKDGRKSFGCHDTREEAQRQLRALYASED